MIAGIVRSISAATLTLLVLAGLLGCGSSFQWEGTWRGNRNLEAKPSDNPYLIRTLGAVKVTILPGGRFEMTEAGVPFTGSVEYRDQKAYLKIETRFNTPLEKESPEIQETFKAPIELTPQKDGTISYTNPTSFDSSVVTLKREKKD